MRIYDFINYKKFTNKWISLQSKGGRGQLSKMAEYVRVSTTMLSQILNGDKHLSLETATEVAEFMSLNAQETEYFLLMIDYERAGSHKLKKILEKKILREQENAQLLKNKQKQALELSELEKSQFYSSWLYSAVRLLSSLDEINNQQDIAKYLNLPLPLVNEVVEFLISKNLCKIENNKLTYATLSTVISRDSIFVNQHHANWRHKSLEVMAKKNNENLFYTIPMALSVEAQKEIYQMIQNFSQEVMKVSRPSKSESLSCLNIDWFKI